jgi:hypothetical protein
LSVRKGEALPVPSLAVLLRQYKGHPYDAGKYGLLDDDTLAQLSAQFSTGLVEQTNVSYFNTTVRYCAVLHAYGRPAELLDYGNLVIYVLHLCLKERVCGTTAGQYVSHVRSIGGAAGWPDKQAPGSTQRAMLKNVLRGLKKAFPSASAPRQPVRLAHLEKIRTEMDRQVALSPGSRARIDFQWLALCVSHQLMLRASELVNLAVGDVSQYDDTSSGGGKGLVVCLRNTKTAREGQVFRVHLHARADRFDCVSRVWALASGRASSEPLFDFRGYLGGAATAAEGVFQNKQANIMTQVVRFWLAASGQVTDAETMACYVAHSLRHGGCTDLLDSGVPLDTVMRQGRWKSAAWLIYKHTTEVTRGQLSLLAVRPIWVPVAGSDSANVRPLAGAAGDVTAAGSRPAAEACGALADLGASPPPVLAPRREPRLETMDVDSESVHGSAAGSGASVPDPAPAGVADAGRARRGVAADGLVAMPFANTDGEPRRVAAGGELPPLGRKRQSRPKQRYE